MTTYNTTSYAITTPLLGVQPLSASFATAVHPLGKIVTAEDATYGEGEFVYLEGVVNTVVGSVVSFDTKAGTTTLSVADTLGPVAVAMSANVASQYGWYQISGSCANVLGTGTCAAGDIAYTTSTAGEISSTVVTGSQIDGMVITVALTSGVAVAQLDRPNCNGNGVSA